ncbi:MULTISPECIES: VWA domain-containing protein [unclassified Beijerinckia]|uniref:vWA domain-containing protein n=1 Tax=unclassified Beijerinckia TaxID=2638183 RepID=UPI00089556E7|nr:MULTISPECIES: VWA domain-containing protein [unclassified Beijerinckia]MDH7799260.1 uncharacterized protein YegL [Beijerinckia sp. GAS462]SED90439.1 Uncharacterized conserved protein YegL, contains vWA domain of TerY type [Beijerinckia sp. 28-YEA-48]
MSNDKQEYIGDSGLLDSRQARCPCILLFDVSISMEGAAIAPLNEGLRLLQEEVQSDSLAAMRVEIATVTLDPLKAETDVTGAKNVLPTPFSSQRAATIGEAIETALQMLRDRKDRYRASGISFYRPWIVLITDGIPSSNLGAAAKLIQDGEAAKAFSFYVVGTDDADLGALAKLSVRQPLKLKGLQFNVFFKWLSNSLIAISRSNPGDPVPLANPAGPNGWAVPNGWVVAG